jgi:hypothetical protein
MPEGAEDWAAQASSPRCTNGGRIRRIERVADRPFEGEEAVLHVMGWVGRPRRRGRFVDGCLLERRRSNVCRIRR